MDRGSAEGTGGVRGEPRVDARGVEGVAAVRKQTAFVAVGELRQADGAVLEVALGCGGVSEGGERLENGRVKTFFLGGSGGRKWMREEEVMAAATAAEVDVGADGDKNEYECEEKDGSGNHDLAVLDILLFNVRIHSHGGEGNVECKPKWRGFYCGLN